MFCLLHDLHCHHISDALSSDPMPLFFGSMNTPEAAMHVKRTNFCTSDTSPAENRKVAILKPSYGMQLRLPSWCLAQIHHYCTASFHPSHPPSNSPGMVSSTEAIERLQSLTFFSSCNPIDDVLLNLGFKTLVIPKDSLFHFQHRWCWC